MHHSACTTQSETLEGIRGYITGAIEGYLEVLAERVAPGRVAPGDRAVRTFHVELATL